MNPLYSLRDYEQFIYTLPLRHISIQRSTLTVIRRGADVARLIGDVELAGGYRLVVREKLSFADAYGIKHHRIPAPQLSFTRPNLPVLIEEIQSLAHAA